MTMWKGLQTRCSCSCTTLKFYYGLPERCSRTLFQGPHSNIPSGTWAWDDDVQGGDWNFRRENSHLKRDARCWPHVRSLNHCSQPDSDCTRACSCELAVANDLDAIKALVTGENLCVASRDYDYRTPLHLAAAQGNQEMVEYLLAQGAQNQFDRLGGLPIHDAVRHTQSYTLARIFSLKQAALLCR